MRALVISDTHFGAWTGEDLLRDPETLALLEPQLDVDEVIFLGDMFDFLFGSMRDSFDAARGLFGLLRDKLQGKRFVFLAGNHDHQLVVDASEVRLQLELATGRSPSQLRDEIRRVDVFRRLFESQLEGVEVEIRYPTYTFAGVLCTHGHYPDFHTRRGGGRPGRLLAEVLWSVAVGGPEHIPTVDDYEATITMLTGLLFTIAQLPNGTHAQRRLFRLFQQLERAGQIGSAPARALERLGTWSSEKLGLPKRCRYHAASEMASASYEEARSHESARRQRTGAPAGGEVSSYMFARSIAPGEPSAAAVGALENVILNLGWSGDVDKIVFAHTHLPLDGAWGPHGEIRYWNTGSWIYEPDLRSREAYIAYLETAWPGTAIVIDSDDSQPRLLRMREHLNPLRRVQR